VTGFTFSFLVGCVTGATGVGLALAVVRSLHDANTHIEQALALLDDPKPTLRLLRTPQETALAYRRAGHRSVAR
jgi:hypothetical protein